MKISWTFLKLNNFSIRYIKNAEKEPILSFLLVLSFVPFPSSHQEIQQFVSQESVLSVFYGFVISTSVSTFSLLSKLMLSTLLRSSQLFCVLLNSSAFFSTLLRSSQLFCILINSSAFFSTLLRSSQHFCVLLNSSAFFSTLLRSYLIRILKYSIVYDRFAKYHATLINLCQQDF